MGLFKKKVIKEIYGGAWGHLVNDHRVDVDTLANDFKCVEREGFIDGKGAVTLLRVFKPGEAMKRGVSVTGWDTFEQYPELILFEGYLTSSNEAHLERKRN